MTIMKYLFQFVFINYEELIVSHYTYIYIEKLKIFIMIISKALAHKTMIAIIIIIIIFLLGSLLQCNMVFLSHSKLEKLELTLVDIFNITILVTIIYYINHDHHNYDWSYMFKIITTVIINIGGDTHCQLGQFMYRIYKIDVINAHVINFISLYQFIV